MKHLATWSLAWWGISSLLCPGSAHAQLFSPGELSRAHRELEGSEQCFRCHEAGKEISAVRCMKCHAPIRRRVTSREGLHGHLPDNPPQCGRCHVEHLGRDNVLIRLDRERFDHRRTGFVLKGKHRRLACQRCHEPRRIIDAELEELTARKKSTYLGLPTACGGCHFDEHRGQTAAKCQKCHDEGGFAGASRFGHDRTNYPLTGRHQRVECARCHPKLRDTATPTLAFPAPRSRTYSQWVGVPLRCNGCHADPHKGRFSPRCDNCHTTAGWKQMKPGARDTGFHDDHRFKLEGGHVGVPCKSCHGPFPGQPARFRGLPFGRCTDCHIDGHVGQLDGGGLTKPGGADDEQKPRAKPGTPPRCENCHVVAEFKPPHFEVEDHAKTRFVLEGAHRAVPCGRCHPQDESLRRALPATVARKMAQKERPMRISLARLRRPKVSGACDDCHEDVHGGQFLRGEPVRRCSTCHESSSFHQLRFDHQRDTRFPLAGKHAKTACASCHRPEGERDVVGYRGLPEQCAFCHFDVHLGQLSTNRRGPSAPLRDTPCEACHEATGFKPARFEHSASRFVLDGAHRSLTCNACHPKRQIGRHETTWYRPLPITCEGCHRDFHEGALREVPQ